MKKTNLGKLYLLPGTLGDSAPDLVLPEHNLQIIRRLNCFVVEELKTARRFLRKCGFTTDFEEVTFNILNEHTSPEEVPEFLSGAFEGTDIGLLSEAGCPAVADPGSGLVRAAHEKGIRVIPLSGPSSIILALMASGFNGQQFAFHGYLPVKEPERIKKIRDIEREVYKCGQTQIFIEAPYRNRQMIDSIIKTCSAGTMLSIAVNLTQEDEEIITDSVVNWKKRNYDPGKRPAVFIISK
ncbi:MAG: SAM-dependent methyltransferase [Lentimicrobium sp.]|nr:SAM-dependent methyltransferase [Lentimicrobium sp.]